MVELATYIDGTTLMVVNCVLHSASAIMMMSIYLAMPRARGLPAWIMGNLACAVGFFLLCSHSLWPPVVFSLIANLLIDLGAILSYVAVLQFLQRPRRDLWLILPSIFLGLVETAHFATFGIDLRAGVLLGCGLRAIVTIGVGWQLLRRADPQLRPATTVSAVFHLLWAAMLVSRMAWWVFSEFPDRHADPTTPYGLIVRLTVTFVVTPCYCWMMLRQRDDELLRRTREDSLTGIANRKTMWERGEKAVATAMSGSRKLAVLMIDIDHFKAINVEYGHDIGDKVLIQVAESLSGVLQANDLVGRIGGEEFMVLLPERGRTAALVVAERLMEAVQAIDIRAKGHALRCTISIGCSMLVHDGENWDAIVSAADRGLYRAKQLGRNRAERAPSQKALSFASEEAAVPANPS